MFGLFKKKTSSYKNIDIDEFLELKAAGAVVLDVRSPKEVDSGAIPGHQHINISDSSFEYEAAKLDKSKPYLVYCKSGMRSAKACRVMSELGFSKLYNFKGGMMAWNAQS